MGKLKDYLHLNTVLLNGRLKFTEKACKMVIIIISREWNS